MKSKKDLLSTKHSLLRNTLFGAISGFVAGIIMTPFLMLIGVIMGIDPNTISIARGMAFGFNSDNNYALIVGLVIHLLTSTVIGIIFAILVTKVNRLKITRYKKGSLEGIIMGIVVFAILYIPTTLVMIQPQLHILISQNNPALSQTQTQILGENIIVTGLGFLAHIVYGVVLGSMTTFLLRRRPGKQYNRPGKQYNRLKAYLSIRENSEEGCKLVE